VVLMMKASYFSPNCW